MILSDKTIKEKLESGDINIEPFVADNLQPASYDVTLGEKFLVFDNTKGIVIDPEQDNSKLMREVTVDKDNPFILHPGQFALAATAEHIGVSEEYLYILNGKSSLGRLGLLIHATAGFIDPGNSLNVTLELFNVATMPILLRAGMKIGQVVFQQLTEAAERPYGHPDLNSKYYGARGVQASQMHKNYADSQAD